MRSFSILLVEDDDDARQNMEDILAMDGYAISSVRDCQTAVEAVEQNQFDAVIIDWSLPDGSGGDLMPLILKELPSTPVIVVTGMRDFDAVVVALKSGAYDFLLKPVNPDVLRSVLRRLVERGQHLLEIEKAQQKLLSNERLAAIGQMVAGLAHESRNAFQRSHACLAELTLDLQEVPHSLALVNKVQRALDDINFLLEQVRNYSAPIILERRPCLLPKLIEEVWLQISEVRPNATVPEFQLVCEEYFPECFLDDGRIKQVVRNLLENAWDACGDPGRVEVQVLRPSDDVLRIAVSDNGKGVEPHQTETIFNPFFTTKTKGTGLGLAISQRIVDAHHGRIYFEDRENGGARFIVDLPANLNTRKNKPEGEATC